MQIDRRSFIAALAASVAGSMAPAGFARADERLFVSSTNDAGGMSALTVFSVDGGTVFRTKLPARGHDIAVHPTLPDLAVFARRPGDWTAVVNRRSGAVITVIRSPEHRHYYGHGMYSADGRLLYATENDLTTGQGVLGVYDVARNYARIGEQPTHGVGPHDTGFLPDGKTIVVANGGAKTDPASGREILNKHAMTPSLSLFDATTGDLRHKIDFGPELSGLSMRHLAVAPDGEVVFASQYEGDLDEMPPLVGTLTPDGKTRFLEIPDRDLASLNSYLGAVQLDRSGRLIAATSPRGGFIVFWDRESGRYLGRAPLPDVCGVAAAPEKDGLFVVSSGNSGVRMADATRHDVAHVGGSDLYKFMWDNHIEMI